MVVVGSARYPVPPQGLRVGRSADNDIVLPDPNVSRQHLLIWTTPRGTFLRDLGSQNGTYVDAARVGPGPEVVPPGARVRLGRSELRIERRPNKRGRRAGPRPSLVGLVAGLAVIGLLVLAGLALVRTEAVSRVGAVPAAEAIEPSAGGAPDPPGSRRDPGLVRALSGAVQVLMRIETGQISTGSGTVITPRGHILTNYHVVGDNASGRLHNRTGEVIIAVPPAEGEPARPRFLARIAASDPTLDIALLRISAPVGGGPLPTELDLVAVPIGDSDAVKIGDPLTIVGYPGVGGQGVTVTRGIHSGVQTLRGQSGTFFKTDTEISAGNSGGTAINAAGELVGIPTAGVTNQSATARLGLVRPINPARPLIDRALQE
ncbi:MAG: trypsin-like peptidase domain-containing protein [Chloroflexi bacterium]|nr:trypsin-like peptidase domain-containing protein [Chloroflexota bacterium]